jgi:hypothetical protein
MDVGAFLQMAKERIPPALWDEEWIQTWISGY